MDLPLALKISLSSHALTIDNLAWTFPKKSNFWSGGSKAKDNWDNDASKLDRGDMPQYNNS